MKLQPLAMVVFLMSPLSAANCSRRHAELCLRSQKKPVPIIIGAGCLCLKLNFTLPFALFLSLAPPSLQPHPFNLITQTPSSL